MAELTIITNNVPRDLIEAYELTAEERSEFDYLNWQAIDEGTDSATFFRYKGTLYDFGEFESLNHRYQLARENEDKLKDWSGIQPDSFFSGLLIRWPVCEDVERLVIARYYC